MRLSPSAAVLFFAIFVSASPPREITSLDLIVPEHGVHANASSATTTAAGPETTPPPEDDLVLQQLNKRDTSNICGVIGTTTLTCPESKDSCVWDPTPGGPFGCCPVNEDGYADSSCILKVKCIDFADYYLNSSTEPPDQATLVCVNPARPFCARQVLYGTLTRPDGTKGFGLWTQWHCANTSTTEYGTVWTNGEDQTDTARYHRMIDQNFIFSSRQGALVFKTVSQFAVNFLANAATALPPITWPWSLTRSFNDELSAYVADNPSDVGFSASRSSVVDNSIKPPEYIKMAAENMPVTLFEYADTDPIPLFAINDDQRAAAIELFEYFRPDLLELLNSSAMLPRQAEDSDTTIEVQKELTRIQSEAMLLKLFAWNLYRCSLARQIRAYTGRANVTTTTLNIAAGPLGPSFTTVVSLSSIPGMADWLSTTPTTSSVPSSTSTATGTTTRTTTATTTSTTSSVILDSSIAGPSRTCADGNVIPTTQECAASRVGGLNHPMWPIWISLVVVVPLVFMFIV